MNIKKIFLVIKKEVLEKLKLTNVLYDIEKSPNLDKKLKHDISILVDRIVLNSKLGNRLAESIETAVNLSNGLVFVEYEDETLPQKFRKIEKLIFQQNLHVQKVVLQLKKLNQDYFLLIVLMVLVKNVKE